MLVVQSSGLNNDSVRLVFSLRREWCSTVTAKLAPRLEAPIAVGKVQLWRAASPN